MNELFEQCPGLWLVIGTILIVCALLAIIQWKRWMSERKNKIARRERFLVFLICLMLFFLIWGTALHFWAFLYDKKSQFSHTEYLFRSLVCSFQLFAANIDSNVLDNEYIQKHTVVKGLISLQAVLSFSCTVSIIFSLAYGRVKAYFKLHHLTFINADRNHLYIFFGLNEPSRLLAKSIHDNDRKALILFVENSHIDEDEYGGWDSVVGMFTHRRQTFIEIEELKARVTFTETRLCDINIKDVNEKKDILAEINLLKLKKLILKLTKEKNLVDAKLHIFFLSENEDENIQAISVLAQDLETIGKISTNNEIEHTFYCHARQNGLNRVVEDIAVKRGLNVRIVDSSHLAIELLKEDENNHPVRLVELDESNPTTVKSEFNSLIVGFDEAGQDALKFLYEFGAFVSNEGTPEREVRSPFHCVVTDKKMDILEGMFSTFAPSVIKQENKDGSKLVEFVKCDCMNGEFFKNVVGADMCKKLNYVIIAIGNDDLAMMFAIKLMSHIRRHRADLSRLRIYVRSYRLDKESYMQKIADYYNEGYDQDCEKNKQQAFKTDAIIIPFGQSEKIYSFDMIIREKLVQKGKAFHERYREMKGESEDWDTRRGVLTGSKEKGTKKNIPIGERKVSLSDMRSLRRKESQDLANALHIKTKMFLLQKAFGEGLDWKEFVEEYFDEKGKPIRKGSYANIKYTLSEQENYGILNTVILNLARLEHLRWNASHEMLGYTKADKGIHSCDERTKRHNCLRPWEELDKEGRDVRLSEGWDADYKAFDFCIVDVSIWLYYDEMQKNGNKQV